MRSLFRLRLLALALTLSALTSLSGCTTRQQVVEPPTLPPLAPPSECSKAGFSAFAGELEGLPTGFKAMDPNTRARILLTIKDDDAVNYKSLRSQAIRCAPQ